MMALKYLIRIIHSLFIRLEFTIADRRKQKHGDMREYSDD